MSICTDHDQIYRLHFKVYGAAGHWRTLSSSKWKQFIWDLYFGTVHLAIIIQTIALLIDAYIIRQNLEKLSTNLCSSITFIGTVYKIWVFIVNQKTIETLSHKLQNNLFISRVGQSKSDKDILQKYSKLVAKVLRALGLMASFLIVFWSVFPILDSGSEKRYPFPFPVYNAPTPIYEIVYVYQVLILVSVSFNVLTYDMIFYGFMARICAQYEILAKNMSQIKDLSCDKGKGRSVNEDEVKKIKDKEVIKIIKENVIHHKEILRQIKDVESLFSGPIFVQITCGASLIGVIAYGLTAKLEVFTFEQMQRLFYVECALLDIWFYCYFGTQLETKNNEIRDALYDNPWFEMKVETRKLYMIMISNLQRKVRIRGGGIFPVTLKTYLGLLKISYNLTAILRQTRSRN